MMMKRLCVALLSLSLLACSSDKVALEPARLADFKPSAAVEVRWQAQLGAAGINVLSPVATREGVYAASAKYLFRFERDTGKQVWRVEPGFTISGGVGAGEGVVLVGSDKGELAAYAEADGKLRWKVRVSSEVLSAPKAEDGIVVVRSGNGKIAGLDVQDGKLLWLYEHAMPPLAVRSAAGVIIRNGLVYAGFAGGKLAAIGLTKGTVIWESSVSQPRGNTELERISDITSQPAVDDAQACAVSFQGRLACFDAVQGGALWTRDLSSDKGMALSGKVLYLTDTEGNVLALDKTTGGSVWKNGQLLRRRVSAAYALDDRLLLGDFEGYVHVLKAEDGSLAARLRTDGSAILAASVMLGDGALVQTSDGSLYSIAVH